MKDRPYLVQLESVEHEYENELMAFLASLAFFSVLISMFFDIPRYIGIAFLLILVLNTKWKYRTDRDELYLEAKGFFDYKWKTSVKWTDVVDASMVNPKMGRILFTLNNGKKKSVTLGRIKGKFSDIYNHRIEASIYQHLQKVGKAGSMQLRTDAKSYFIEIPDWIPYTISVEREEDEFLAIYTVDSGVLEVKWKPKGEDISCIEELPKDRIEFVKVQYCKWNPHTHNGFEFEIFTGDSETKIKVNEDELEMQKLVLAVIRQVRKNPATDAIWLPNVLVGSIQSGAIDE
jgi:hypothetical protein